MDSADGPRSTDQQQGHQRSVESKGQTAPRRHRAVSSPTSPGPWMMLTVRATFAYDTFGRGKATGTTFSSGWDSRLRFQTAPRDPSSGKYTLGPRLYDPATYRFIGVDTLLSSDSDQALQLDPLTGNRYLYAGANPVNLIDDGHGPKKGKGSSASSSPPSSLLAHQCQQILKNIKKWKNICERRIRQFKESKKNFKPNDDATRNHQQQFRDAQANLRKWLREWDSAGCGGKGLGSPPAHAWRLATREVPVPNLDPARFASKPGLLGRFGNWLDGVMSGCRGAPLCTK